MGAKRPVFIIGTPRSGTTALAESVSQSLGLSLVRGKETHFLAAKGMPERSGGPHGPGFDRLRAKSITEFRARLSPDHSDTGFLDASATSLYYASAAVESLNEHFPDARLIAVLRNPIDRAESAHRFMTGRGFEPLPMLDALREEPLRIAQGWVPIFYYVRAGLYADQVEALGRWRQKTLFLLYERDLSSETLIDRIAEHTGYPVLRRHALVTRNEARTFASPALGRTFEWLRSTKAVATAPPWIRTRARDWVVDRFRGPSTRELDPAARETLKASFINESARLAELTGLAVDTWFGEGGD